MLGRDASGTPRAIRTKRGVTAIRVAIREANALLAFNRQGKDAIRTDSPPTIAEPTHHFRRTFKAMSPLPDSEQEIVSCSLHLEQARSHGAAPITTVQLAASLRLPASSLATTK